MALDFTSSVLLSPRAGSKGWKDRLVAPERRKSGAVSRLEPGSGAGKNQQPAREVGPALHSCVLFGPHRNLGCFWPFVLFYFH